MNKPALCDECKGKGTIDGIVKGKSKQVHCEHCHGTGVKPADGSGPTPGPGGGTGT